MNYRITTGLPAPDMTPRGQCFSWDGIPSENESEWATFFTHEEAEQFAKKHDIQLNNFSSTIVPAK